MRIGVAGVTGRVGLMLVEVLGTSFAGGIGRGGDLAGLAARCDVVIDFTHADAVAGHAAVLTEAGIGWVLGTTGLTAADEAAVAAAAQRIGVVFAANFSPGVALVIALAERMAAALPAADYDAEILEMHHRQKVDAPSGTALAIGRAVAAGRGVDLAAVRASGRDGQTGERRTGDIGFAALRGGQVVGDHSLIFAGAAERITISHEAFDRMVFARGAMRAALWLQGKAPGLYGMADILGL
ncbi:MAG: 4-hydroxy-tetrahydrodipicolinate reductase [Rhodospirillales bacterium 20-60-12]|nr:MAG: 4-hydroxy-tetrahydrodipicolinate reductase [Rhodospirillales bacterium 20-60-12]HQT68057.1 4-hydroxy-tetrahydrodipicolinate reductase [Acetobacteraceae bacterium]HQU01603.1 4-hydroxy-tetrahydrodipicolinate reductase [Acetobacteraceae bacterium]